MVSKGTVMRGLIFLVMVLTLSVPGLAYDATLVGKATRLVEHLDAGRFEAAREDFSERMAEALSADQLQQLWTGLPAQVGPRTGTGAPRTETMQSFRVVVIPIRHEIMTLDVRVTFDQQSQAVGFHIVPAAPASPPAPPPEGTLERAVQFGPEGSQLPGLITVPAGDGPFPAVVLVHGSGPHDRDQTIGPNRPFRDIAHGLAERGIASLRYDKRTAAYPSQFQGVYTVDDEVVNDVVWAVRFLHGQTDVDADQVYVVGHSLGGMMAPRIAKRVERVAGLVLLAAPARPLQVLVVEQNHYLFDLAGGPNETQRQQLAELEQMAAAVSDAGNRAPGEAILLGMPASYWADLNGYDPVQAAADSTLPMLVVHAGRDFQVIERDYARWQGLLPSDRITLKRYENLNHLLMPGAGRSSLAEYFIEGQHVDGGVLDDLAAWIVGRAQQ